MSVPIPGGSAGTGGSKSMFTGQRTVTVAEAK